MSEEKYAKIISKNLRRIMSDKGLTQAEVSRTLHINKATLSSWMNGTRIPRMQNIDMLCHYFNVSRADIMEDVQNNGQDEGYYIDGETARIAQAIFENKELRLLFDEMADAEPSTIKATHEMLLTLKRKENGEYD